MTTPTKSLNLVLTNKSDLEVSTVELSVTPRPWNWERGYAELRDGLCYVINNLLAAQK